ncbi:hypothetical protein [Bradyrhizobium sp. LA6.12]|uniref:hypothetical protein n=1 Tax=unclassified Bradyrhizobium TaxID=2631580 RepID=UPI0033943E61
MSGTKNGHDWTKRYPRIVETALQNRQKRFVIDGEAVVLTMTGLPDFDALHSRRHDDEVQLYAFDILAGDGDDYRLARRPEGIFTAPYEQGEIGPELFRHACLHRLEGMVSKHGDRTYRAGRCDHWIKVKNRKHPAFHRVRDRVSPPKKITPVPDGTGV